MATRIGPIFLAATGSTGTPTSAALAVGAEIDKLGVEGIVEAIGATPTITWKIQCSIDNAANWFDAPYVTPASDALSQVPITRTTVGADQLWIDLTNRQITHVRLVVTANTNVTFRVEAYLTDEFTD